MKPNGNCDYCHAPAIYAEKKGGGCINLCRVQRGAGKGLVRVYEKGRFSNNKQLVFEWGFKTKKEALYGRSITPIRCPDSMVTITTLTHPSWKSSAASGQPCIVI